MPDGWISTRAALRSLGCAYLAGVWLSGIGSTLASRLLPRALAYFLQIAALFPDAATASIDYRAEGWVCGDRRWQEIDTGAYFPLDADHKENRFQRVMHFYRENRATMRALDDYFVQRHSAAQRPDGIALDRTLGGVRMCSLRIPIPAPGTPIEPFRRQPLADYPQEERNYFYHTPKSTLMQRCRDSVSP